MGQPMVLASASILQQIIPMVSLISKLDEETAPHERRAPLLFDNRETVVVWVSPLPLAQVEPGWRDSRKWYGETLCSDGSDEWANLWCWLPHQSYSKSYRWSL